MNNKQNNDSPKPIKSSGNLFLKVFGYALLFGGMLSGGLLLFCNSDAGAEFLFNQLARQIDIDGGKFEYSGLKGNLLDGLDLEEISARTAQNSFFVKASGINAKFDFSGILTKAGLGVSLKCSEIVASGKIQLPILDKIPPPPELSCLVNNHLPFFINRIELEKIDYFPFSDADFVFSVSSISLSLPIVEKEKAQQVNFAFLSKFKNRRFAIGSYSGELQQKKGKMTGVVSACVIDQKFESEVLIEDKKRDFKISGYVSSTTIDLAKISRWLIPLWQDSMPFGCDGGISLNGSWMFSRGDGFFSNFSGTLNKVRVVALGFFYTILELNANWKYFNNELIFEDVGSTMLGFPASFSGRIETPAKSPAKWFLDFSSEIIDVENLVANLPWGLRYSLDLPPMSGVAGVSIKFRKNLPEVFANVISNKIVIGKDKREVDFKMNFKTKAFNQSEFALNFKQRFFNGLPSVFNGFSEKFPQLRANLGRNIMFDGVIKGKDFFNARLSGQLTGKEIKFDVLGNWDDGKSNVVINVGDKKFSKNVLVYDLFFLD